MTVVDSRLRPQIAQKVQTALDHHQPRRYRILVKEDAILEDDGWYHVVVETTNDERDRDFYDAVAEAEAELNDSTNDKQYLIVPAIGD